MAINQQKIAEKVLQQTLPQAYLKSDYYVRVLEDGTLLLFIPMENRNYDSLAILSINAEICRMTVAAPIVVCQDDGRLARRIVIPYKQWVKPDRLHARFNGVEGEQVMDHASIRMIKDIPGDVVSYQYGRGSRLRLILERRVALLAVQVFPGGLYESDMITSHERLKLVGWLMLSREGILASPFGFHMLRNDSFFSIERAVVLPRKIRPDSLKTLETLLLKGAEEDRKVISALLSPQIPADFLMQTGGGING